MKFGEQLIAASLIDEAQLQAALSHQKQTGQPLGEALLELGYLSEENFLKALARNFHTQYVPAKKLAQLIIPPAILSAVDKSWTEQHLVTRERCFAQATRTVSAASVPRALADAGSGTNGSVALRPRRRLRLEACVLPCRNQHPR